MKIRTRVQTLVAASMLALVAVSLSVGQADAKPKDPVQFGKCALPGHIRGDEEDWVFYVEGETVWVDINGKNVKIKCGPDGKWTVVQANLTGTPSIGQPVVALPGGAVVQP